MFKLLFKGVSGFLAILMMATTMTPPTVLEKEALGANPARMDLVQMRLARAMMNVAPDQSVALYAKATQLPEDTIRASLDAIANGTFSAEAEPMPEDAPQRFSDGAKFIKIE